MHCFFENTDVNEGLKDHKQKNIVIKTETIAAIALYALLINIINRIETTPLDESQLVRLDEEIEHVHGPRML